VACTVGVPVKQYGSGNSLGWNSPVRNGFLDIPPIIE